MSIPHSVVPPATELPSDLAGTAARPDLTDDEDVRTLVQRAGQAHTALMQGDVNGHRSCAPLSEDFVLMSPFGGEPTRPVALSEERWASIGRFFKNGRHASFELIQAYRTADMVVLAAIERAHVEVGGLAGQDWALRVTLVFRKERGEWMLAHRHADPLAAGIELSEAAAMAGARSRP